MTQTEQKHRIPYTADFVPTASLCGSGIEEPIAQTQTKLKPKFIDGQKLEFKITLTATAIIDGAPDWDEDEQKYLYVVSHVTLTDEQCKEDICLTDCKVTVEEPCLLWEDEIVTENLPSCEFDPN